VFINICSGQYYLWRAVDQAARTKDAAIQIVKTNATASLFLWCSKQFVSPSATPDESKELPCFPRSSFYDMAAGYLCLVDRIGIRIKNQPIYALNIFS